MLSDDILKLTVLTAEPILRLLMARLGHEGEDLPFPASWVAFRRFMSLPTTVSDGGGTVQIARSEADGRVLEIFIGRQLGEELEYGVSVTRVVGIHFLFSPDERDGDDRKVLDIEMRSDGYPSVADFFSAVEATDAFRFASTAPRPLASFYSHDS